MLTEKGKKVVLVGLGVIIATSIAGPVGGACIVLAVLLYKATKKP